MGAPLSLEHRLRTAWQGRISGCQLGKPIELISLEQSHDALHDYLVEADALPLRDYLPALEGTVASDHFKGSCKGHMVRSEPDDDINYTVLALTMLEEHGIDLDTADVARAWMKRLPVAWTFTAERATFRTLINNATELFAFGHEPGFDLAECSDNEWNDYIGAQIRADLYGWVCPGRHETAAELARRDASLSHRGEGVYGAMFVAALGAAIPSADNVEHAVEIALDSIPSGSDCAYAVRMALHVSGDEKAGASIRRHFDGLSPIHTVNNLALVVWSLTTYPDDFSAAIGEVVAAGLDTDCNGATVGGLWGLQGKPIPASWTAPWQGRVAVTLSGMGELELEDLVRRTMVVTERLTARSSG